MSNGASLSYDPAGNLFQTTGGGATTRLLYDGDRIIGEYDGSGNLLRRYVPGANAEETAVWYEGSGTSDKRFLVQDWAGSVIAATDASGNPTIINKYDEAGIPGPSNAGRFQWRGQPWIPEAGLYHMRARAYSPTLGRFMQPDPIGTAGGINLYAYAGNDPVNNWDPSGLAEAPPPSVQEVLVIAENLANIQRELAEAYQAFTRSFQNRGNTNATGASDPRNGTPQSTQQLAKNDQSPESCPAGYLPGVQAGLGTAGANTAMPTQPKPGAIGGGGKSGPWTSPASAALRDMTGRARFGPLRPLTGTSSVGGSLGRALPGIGAFLTLFDFLEMKHEMEVMDKLNCVPVA